MKRCVREGESRQERLRHAKGPRVLPALRLLCHRPYAGAVKLGADMAKLEAALATATAVETSVTATIAALGGGDGGVDGAGRAVAPPALAPPLCQSCQVEHPLDLSSGMGSDGYGNGGGFICDGCGVNGRGERWHCSAAAFDVCLGCVPRAGGTVPAGESLPRSSAAAA